MTSAFNPELLVRAPIALAPVVLFLAALLHFDSYKLLRFRMVLTLMVVGALAAGAAYPLNSYAYARFPGEFVAFSRYVSPWIEESLKFVLSLGVAPAKLSLGIPGYSDWWYPVYDSISGARMRGSDISYTRAQEILAKSGVKAVWDEVQKSPKASWSDHDVFQHLWMEDQRAFTSKLALVTKYNLRGYSVWVLGLEDPATWRALK